MGDYSLQDLLDETAAHIDMLKESAKRAMHGHVAQWDSQIPRLKFIAGKDRYMIVRPDGAPAMGFPFGFFGQVGYSQKPAAMRQLNALAANGYNVRIIDMRTNEVIEPDKNE